MNVKISVFSPILMLNHRMKHVVSHLGYPSFCLCVRVGVPNRVVPGSVLTKSVVQVKMLVEVGHLHNEHIYTAICMQQ